MPQITKKLIAALEPTAKKYFVWDSQPPGFGICVTPAGNISFVYQFRNSSGQSRRLKIGATSALSPDQARKHARDLAHQVSTGLDPSEIRAEARAAQSLDNLFEAYLASETFAEKAESTRATDVGRLRNHLTPTLGKKIAANITSEDVKAAYRAIRDGKTERDEKIGWRARSRVRGGEGAARQSIRLLKSVFSWAISNRHVDRPDNPASDVSVTPDGEREQIMGGPDDYRRLFETLDKMQTERRIQPAVADIVRLLALTGARRGEITGLKWREVNFEKRLIIKPPGNHKTGRRTGKPRLIGLPSLAITILKRQPAGDVDDLVFPPTRIDAAGRGYPASKKQRDGRVNVSAPWRKIRAEASLPEGIGLHGLRHSLASHMAMQGAEAAQIMTQMGHRQMRTVQRYIHYAEDARSQLAEDAARMILRDVEGDNDGK
ncbi:MAG: site-specific integrase [Pseudomonadota bacterium]